MADIRYATVTQVGDGVQTNWNFGFAGAAGTPGYLSQDDVKCYTLDPANVRNDRSRTFVGPNTITVTPAVLAGHRLVIYRDTPKDKPLVDFETTAVLNEAVLDQSARQCVYVAAETLDAFAEAKVSIDGVQGSVQAARDAQTGAEAARDVATAQASLATAQVGLAAAQAIAAAASAGTATTQAGIATTQAGVSTTQAGIATAQAAAAAATYLGFDKRYLGSKASAPTLDNQGAALTSGAVYYNTTVPQWYVYNTTTGWQVPANNSLRTGSGAPAAGLGLDGDVYYDRLNYAIYGPKVSGGWGGGTGLIGPAGPGTGDVTGPSASLDSEVAIYNGSTGKLVKRSSLTATVVKIASGVMSAAAAAIDYVAPGAIARANGLTMATNKLLGRGSASTGSVEEITLGTGLSLAGTTLNVLPAGSTLVATVPVTSGSAVVNLLSVFTASYDDYLVFIDGVKCSVDDSLLTRVAVAGAAVTAAGNYSSNAANGYMALTGAALLSGGQGMNLVLHISNANATSGMKSVLSDGYEQQVGATYLRFSRGDSYIGTNAITGLQFFWNGGATFAANATIRVYGISKV